MSEQRETRVCTKCNDEKDLITGFYRHHNGSTSFYHTCKSCKYEGTYVKKGRQPVVNGFQKLSPDVQKDILEMRARREKNQEICDKHGLKLHTFLYWLGRRYVQ